MTGRTHGALTALAFLFFADASAAQNAPAADEVGVKEKLGDMVPLDLDLVDEDGERVTLGSLIDKPTLLSLNYFQCAGICTPQLEGVSELLNRTALEPGKDFQVLTVSFDGRDNFVVAGEKRVNYLKQMRRPIHPSGWRFLTGPPMTTKKLADATGFEFKAWGEDFIHPGVLIVLSPKGKITRYMYGLTYLPADLEMAVIEAAKGLSRPSISKVIKFCYTIVPEGRRAVYALTRYVGVVMVVLIALFIVLVVRKGKGRERNDKAGVK